MKSKSIDQAEIFLAENKTKLIESLYKNLGSYTIESQLEYNQVAVWFEAGASLCYQNGNMQGEGGANWSNPGADSGIDQIADLIESSEELNPLFIEHCYGDDLCIAFELIDMFCLHLCEKENIQQMFD